MTTKRPAAVQGMLGGFAPRPLRDGEAEFALRPRCESENFPLQRALDERKHAVELWEGFVEFGSSINAIESIIAADRATLFPLPGALEWLVKCLERWHRANGDLTMDQAMGLSTYQGGETDAKRNARMKRDQITAQYMARLTAFDFSARAASVLVSRAIELSNHPHPVSAARIAREWPRMKRRDDGTLRSVAALAGAMPDVERQKYLEYFGSPALPKRKRGVKRGI